MPPLKAAPSADKPSFRDCDNCPLMIKLPGGAFTMGSASDPSASPPHRVTVRGFALAQAPVTVAEWRACLAEGGCEAMPRMAKSGDTTPIHNVSFDDAQKYLAWLAAKTGRKYRLPSEAEWEYAARANTTTPYWWGREVGIALANCADCGGNQDRIAPMPSEAFKPNPFGLYGMGGGVAEWTADCWFANYQGAPGDGLPRDQKGCGNRVLRGGSFRAGHDDITVFARSHYDAGVRYLAHGFRVAVDLN
jgi:formylglycine-generating enzyme required for sulfatase activity